MTHNTAISPANQAEPANSNNFILENELWWNIGCTIAKYRAMVKTISAYDEELNKVHKGRLLSHNLQNTYPVIPDKSVTGVRVVVARMTSSDAIKSMQL